MPKFPLRDALFSHHRLGAASFHVPGHKSKAAWYHQADTYYAEILNIDLTEIPGLDDLHHPEEAIREAEELAARCFGAEETKFLVGGSTAGNLAMVLAACGRGDLLLVARDAHKSVIHGLMLAGAQAVFISPRQAADSGLADGVTAENVREALERYPQAVGLLVTCPTYFGAAPPLLELAELLHSHGKLLLVDEAHGAHFGFHPELPVSALSQGADAVVQSTHKMLTAMTMGAMLHLQGKRIDRQGVKRALAMVQSSSPSYPLLASLDISRGMLEAAGEGAFTEGLEAVRLLHQWIKRQTRWAIRGLAARSEEQISVGLQSLSAITAFEARQPLNVMGEAIATPSRQLLSEGKEELDSECESLRASEDVIARDEVSLRFVEEAIAQERERLSVNGEVMVRIGGALNVSVNSAKQGLIRQDPFKAALYDRTGGLDGFRLKEALEQQGCYPELADPVHVLLAYSLASRAEDTRRLIVALDVIAEAHPAPHDGEQASAAQQYREWDTHISEPVAFDWQSIRRDARTETVYLALAECEGAIAAEAVVPYPPGIPILYPGERIGGNTVKQLQKLCALGSRFHGHDVAATGTLPVLKAVAASNQGTY